MAMNQRAAGAALPSRMPLRVGRPRSRLVALAAYLLVAVAGCGSDADDEPTVEGPLPIGADQPQAYTERFLAHNPRAQLQPEHLAIVRLEPTGGDDGDTCAGRDGVDCLPYFIDEEMVVTLAIDDSTSEIGHLVLRDVSGSAVLSLSAGDEPVTAVIAPGEYILELTHVFAGDPRADTPTIFLRPGEALDEQTEAAVAEWAEAEEEASGVRPTAAPRSISVTAARDCLRCNFANSNLTDQHFDGAELTASTFEGATFLRTTLRDATLFGCTLTDLSPGKLDNANFSDRFHADFSGAKAPGVHFSFAVDYAASSSFFGIFRGAMLDGTVWNQEAVPNCPGPHCPTLRPDFRNASLRGAQFGAVYFTGRSVCPPNSRAAENACTFQGADLTRAVFNRFGAGSYIAHCRFDSEPGSRKITTLREADLRGAGLANGDLSDADLSGAVLEEVTFSDAVNSESCPRPGATLARANLTGAKLGGATLRAANLAGAVLTGIMPASLNGFDLTGTNFSGVSFAGIDLSQTDLSRSTLFSGGTAHFAGATLSDGTRGVNLAGHHFPSRYNEFKGANLTGATLTKAELVEADLERVTLNNAHMVGADLNFANLHVAKLRGACLGVQPGTEGDAASLRGAFMTDIDLSDADLRSVDLTGAHLYGAEGVTSLVRARLDSANLSGAICSGAHFSGTLSNAVFNNAQLVNTVFNGATLTGTKFNDTYLQGADFSNAVGVTGATLTNAAVSAAAGFWSFTEEDGTPYTVRYEATKLGPLATDPTVVCPNAARGPCCPSGDLVACANDKLKPKNHGPYPPVPDCVPKPPKYDNCITPMPTATRRATPTATPRLG